MHARPLLQCGSVWTKAVALALALLVMGSCTRQEKIVITEVANPAAPGSITPNGTVTPSGDILLNWLEPANDGLALRFAVRQKQGWSAPQTIVTRNNFDKYAEAPPWVLVLPDQSLVAVWAEQLPLVQGKKWPGNYLMTTASSDAGKTWSQPAIVHTDRTNGEHSFGALAIQDDRHAAIVWLDARDYEKKHTYRLMSATIDSSGSVKDEKTVDDDVCTCCPTALVKTPQGLVAAYRNRTTEEIRDTYIVREQSGRWQGGQPLHNDGWQFNGCPVNGPALARKDNTVVAAWFSGIEKQASVRIAFSSDGGASFGSPVNVDVADEKADVLGRISVALLDSGDALVSWIRRREGKSQLVVAQVRRQRTVQPQVVAEGSTDSLGYPRMQIAGSDALLLWGGAGDSKQVKTAVIASR